MRLWAGLAIGVVYFAVFLYGVGEAILGDPSETAQERPKQDQKQKQRPKEETTAAPGGQAKTTQEKVAANPLPKTERETNAVALSDADREEVEAVVEQFVMETQGYEGPDEDEFWRRAARHITNEFYSTAGGEELESSATVPRAGGADATPSRIADKYESFEIAESTEDDVRGVAFFEMEGRPSGKKGDYQMELSLRKQEGGSWKIYSGGRLEKSSKSTNRGR